MQNGDEPVDNLPANITTRRVDCVNDPGLGQGDRAGERRRPLGRRSLESNIRPVGALRRERRKEAPADQRDEGRVAEELGT